MKFLKLSLHCGTGCTVCCVCSEESLVACLVVVVVSVELEGVVVVTAVVAELRVGESF